MIDLSGTPGRGVLFDSERARYSTNPFCNVVKRPKIDADSLVHVDRDPCFRCGTRADHGCKHRRAA